VETPPKARGNESESLPLCSVTLWPSTTDGLFYCDGAAEGGLTMNPTMLLTLRLIGFGASGDGILLDIRPKQQTRGSVLQVRRQQSRNTIAEASRQRTAIDLLHRHRMGVLQLRFDPLIQPPGKFGVVAFQVELEVEA